MKILKLSQLQDINEGHILSNIINEKYICEGNLNFGAPGFRTHSSKDKSEDDFHIHDTHEIFIVLQGKARVEINKNYHNIKTGDVFIVEPGEDHHFIVDENDPAVYIWFKADKTRNKNQIL